MISHLKGTVHTKEMMAAPADRLVLDVAGVGFELAVSRQTLITSPAVGEEVTLYTALSIRESEWVLFGFTSSDERQLFGLLQSVSGIGPKTALALVGTLGADRLCQAIGAEDHKTISQAPGVGTKVAQRIILELKGKIADWQERRGARTDAPLRMNKANAEVTEILQALGYTPTEIGMALSDAPADGPCDDVELLMRHCLRVLGAAR